MVNRRIITGWATPRRGMRPLLTLVERLDTGQKLVNNYDSPIYPFFGISLSGVEAAKQWFKDNSQYGIHQIVPFGIPFLLGRSTPMKVEVYNHKDVGICRDILESYGVQTYVSDVPFVRNVMIQQDIFACHDGKLKPVNATIPVYYAAIDIETDDRTAIEYGKNAILAVTVVDMQTKEVNRFILNREMTNEKNMLERIIELLWNYDVIIGWNAEFDREQLAHRSLNLGIRYDWRRTPFVDAMKFYRFIFNKPSNDRLIDVVEREFIKKGCPLSYHGVDHYYELWAKDPDAFLAANTNHALWIYYLEHGYSDDKVRVEGLNIVKLMQTLADHSGILLQEVSSKGVFNDVIALRALKHRYVLGNRKYEDEETHKRSKKLFRGARVLDPKPGRYRDAFVADLKSLYNRIAQVFFLSPEIIYRFIDDKKIQFRDSVVNPDSINTLSYDDITALAEYFFDHYIDDYLVYAKDYTARDGNFFLEGLQQAEELREQYRKLMQQQSEGSDLYQHYYYEQYFFKQQLLIFYGMSGSSSARFFYKIVAALITEIGRRILSSVNDVAVSADFTVVGGDTDSVFLSPPSTRTPDDFVDLVNAYLQAVQTSHNLTPKFSLEIKVDDIWSCLVHTAVKKRYYYREKRTGKVRSKGLQDNRADSFEFLKQIQRDIKDKVTLFADEKDIYDYLDAKRTELVNGGKDVEKKLVMTVGVHKRVEDYKSSPPQVKVAKRLIELGISVARGDRVPYVCATYAGKKEVYLPVVREEIPEIDQAARKWYWERRIFEQLMDLLSPCYDVEKFRLLKRFYSKDEKTLDAFSSTSSALASAAQPANRHS